MTAICERCIGEPIAWGGQKGPVWTPINKKELTFGKPLFCLAATQGMNPGPQHYERAQQSVDHAGFR